MKQVGGKRNEAADEDFDGVGTRRGVSSFLPRARPHKHIRRLLSGIRAPSRAIAYVQFIMQCLLSVGFLSVCLKPRTQVGL